MSALIVVTTDGEAVLFPADAMAQADGVGNLTVFRWLDDSAYLPRLEVSLAQFAGGQWAYWHRSEDVIDDPEGLLKGPLTSEELDDALGPLEGDR